MKRVISALLILVILANTTGFAFACEYKFLSSDIPNNYESYTMVIDSRMNKNNYEDSSEVVYGNSIADVINYVKSLKLEELGFSYIEEICLSELALYEEQGALLASYTILVPKGSKSESIYGTYNGRTFYQDAVAIAAFAVPKNGTAKSSTEFANWVSGAVGLLTAFGNTTVSLYYSYVAALLGLSNNVTIQTGTYYSYYYNFSSAITRTIYSYSGNTKKILIKDQYGHCYYSTSINPVGVITDPTTGTTITSPTVISDGERYIGTKYYSNQTRNLQRSYYLYVHGGSENWTLVTEVLSETWN